MLPSEARHDRGETSIQAVLIVPIVLGIFFLGVHATALAHGSHIAGAAAIRGAQVAAFSGTTGNDVVKALSEVEKVVTDLGTHMSVAPAIRIENKTVTVTVSVEVQSVVPFLPRSVSRTATVSREQFLQEQDR